MDGMLRESSAFDVPRVAALVESISRTASGGRVDTSSAPEKAGIVRPLGAEDTRVSASRNINEAVAGCARVLIEPLSVAADWRVVVEDLNRSLTRGLVDGPIHRSFDSASGLPYIPAHRVPPYSAALYRLLATCETRIVTGDRPRADAIRLAAVATWAVDLRGHLFADGCGRTGLVLSAFILARHDHPLPRFRSRQAYYNGAYCKGQLSGRAWTAFFAASLQPR